MSRRVSAGPPVELQPIIGYRVWTVHAAGKHDVLGALNDTDIWLPGVESEAACDLTPRHRPPVFGCTCGFWAVKQPSELRAVQSFDWQSQVAGAVYLWGRVVEHSGGYRAQCAYPAWFWNTKHPSVRKLAAIYNVPLKRAPAEFWRNDHDEDRKANKAAGGRPNRNSTAITPGGAGGSGSTGTVTNAPGRGSGAGATSKSSRQLGRITSGVHSVSTPFIVVWYLLTQGVCIGATVQTVSAIRGGHSGYFVSAALEFMLGAVMMMRLFDLIRTWAEERA